MRLARSILVRAVELAGEEGGAAIDAEVGMVDAGAVRRGDAELQLHRLRVAEVQPLVGLGDDDGVLPSGVQYMLYGSSTGMVLPGLPVSGSTSVRLPLSLFSALLATYSVFRSQLGTTCCGYRPTGKVLTTFRVAGSMTDTVCAMWLGT